MSHGSWQAVLPLLTSHLAPLALCMARLGPVAFLCPFLGGQAVPGFVRLALLLSVSWALHSLGHLEGPSHVAGAVEWSIVAAKETVLGVAMATVASLPFESSRMAGRFMDQFRGASGEVALPGIGSRESALSHGLYQLLLGLASNGVAMPLVLQGIFRSFHQVPLGAAAPDGGMVFQVVSLAGVAMGAGLAIGAPVAGVGLALDVAFGLASRALPRLGLGELSAPLRLLGGAAVVWLGVGLMATRLLGSFDAVPAQLLHLSLHP